MNNLFALLGLFLISSITLFQAMASSDSYQGEKNMFLDIIDIDDPIKSKVSTTPMDLVVFPLSDETKLFIDALKSKVTQLNAAGLAAPQVGVAKPITAFEVSQEALKWRDDITHLVPLTVLINPSYEPIEDQGLSLDWEGCYSGSNYYGKIWRHKAIIYKGQDIHGNIIQARATGFLARLLQHEIDHCHNKMCIHRYDEKSPQGAQADLISTRKEEVRKKKELLGLGPDNPFPFLEIK